MRQRLVWHVKNENLNTTFPQTKLGNYVIHVRPWIYKILALLTRWTKSRGMSPENDSSFSLQTAFFSALLWVWFFFLFLQQFLFSKSAKIQPLMQEKRQNCNYRSEITSWVVSDLLRETQNHSNIQICSNDGIKLYKGVVYEFTAFLNVLFYYYSFFNCL